MPWLNIEQNVRLLEELVAGRSGAVASRHDVASLLEVVGLKGFEKKLPHQLSGGMQQRAALARALVLDPAVLLMDEPFAALDEITRVRMAFELMRIWQHYRKTVIFVTHSLSEAVFLSDQVVLMTARPGRIHKVFDIDLPRPRNEETRLSDGFLRLVGAINRELYKVMA
jgi:NitT/TauT family transport system ATP-binding protein